MTILDNCYNIDILLISLNKKTKITYKNGNNKKHSKIILQRFWSAFYSVTVYCRNVFKTY